MQQTNKVNRIRAVKFVELAKYTRNAHIYVYIYIYIYIYRIVGTVKEMDRWIKGD